MISQQNEASRTQILSAGPTTVCAAELRGTVAMNEVPRAFEGEQSVSEPNIYVSLTYDALDATTAMARVKNPKAGAVVLFAGRRTTPPAPYLSD